MNLVASEGPERPKRSLSSTIRSFIWGKSFEDQPRTFPEPSKQENASSNVKPEDISKDVEPIAFSEPREDFLDSVIIYEGDSRVRPPVLPILPIQRLRLLRQKQEWRRRRDYNSSLYLFPSNGGEPPSSLVLDLPQNVSYKSSLTPSPTNIGRIRGPPLKRKKTNSNSDSKGTKWSGELEYDLAEYDTAERPSTPAIQRSLPFDQVSAHKKAVDPLKNSSVDRNANSKEISSTQRQVLLKGPKSELAEPENKKGEDAATKKGDKLVLPSVGFDFIKSGDTPSKVKTPQREDESENEPRRKRRIAKPTNSSFKVRAGPAANAKENEKPKSSFTFGEKKDDVETSNSPFHFTTKKDEQPKPAFSFGFKKSEDKKPSPPSLTFGTKKEEQPKPVFDFGDRKNEQTNSAFDFSRKKDEDKTSTPSFDFTTKRDEQPKHAFSFGPRKDKDEISKPSFDFTPKKDEQPKPAFNFGPKKDENENSKPSFDFDDKKGGQLKPAFKFGANNDEIKPFNVGSKKAEVSKSAFTIDEKKSESPKPSFNFGAKKNEIGISKQPFSFSPKGEEKVDSKADFRQTIATAPSFNFGPKKDGAVENTRPKFNFRTESNQNPSVEGDGKDKIITKNTPNFSFGTKPSETKQAGKNDSKPAFSFGTGTNGPSKPTFSFGPNKETAVSNKPTPSFAQGTSKQGGKLNGFSFTRLGEAAQPPALESATHAVPVPTKTFSFGSGITSNDKSSTSNNGNNVFAPIPQAAQKSFSFTRPDSNPSWPSQPVSTSSAPANNSPSFNFKFGTSIPASSTDQPASSNSTVHNPFVNKPSGFTFGSNSAFGTSQAPDSVATHDVAMPTFGSAGNAPPTFGGTITPPVVPNYDSTNRSFTPSNTVNLNFGGNPSSADPSKIFSGNPKNAHSIPAAVPPQQIFGNSQLPASTFGPSGSQYSSGAFGSNGAIMGLPPNPSQPPITNFQLPPGRKLARMRQSRRA